MSTATQNKPSTNGIAKKESNEVATQGPTVAEKFAASVQRQFLAEVGTQAKWTHAQQTLAQHLYVHLDRSMTAIRTKSKYTDLNWETVNGPKLAIDSMTRVALGLDAALPNHIHVVPYHNSATRKYDLDLRIGYAGADLVRRNFAVDPIIDIRYHLVHEGDTFDIEINAEGGERPNHKAANYFQPGPVVGGYGEVMYDDPRKNRVIIVPFREFIKARKGVVSGDFWGAGQDIVEDSKTEVVTPMQDQKYWVEMAYKTVVHRVCQKIPISVNKVGLSVADAIRDSELDYIEGSVAEDAALNANSETLSLPAPQTDEGEQIDTTTGEVATAHAGTGDKPGAQF